MSPPRITALEPSFVTGYWSNLFVGVWRGAPTVAAVNEWERQHKHMAARFPAGFLSIGIIEAQTPIPDAATRSALAESMSRIGPSLRAMAGVQEASGFTGAALRSVMLALSNLACGPYPRRIFGSSAEAAHWLAPHFDSRLAPIGASQILAVIEEFRRMSELAGAISGQRAHG